MISWNDRRLRGTWLALLAAAAVGAVFFPTTLVNGDEYFYAGQALTLSRGRIAPIDGDGLPVPQLSPAEAFKYPIGWPLLLAPSRLISFRAMFAMTLLVHLAAGAVVARMLVRRGLPSWLTVLYLFHPVAWIYSRTLLSDVAATAALLIAIDAWENRDRFICALAAGFAPAARVANLLALLGLALAALPELKHRWRDVIAALASITLFTGLQLMVNYHLTEGSFRSPYASASAQLLNGTMALENGLLYSAGLLLLPPFPLLLLVLRRDAVDRWALAALPVVIFFVLFSYHDAAPNPLHTLIGGQRFVLPAHALLLIATARAWGTWRPLRNRWVVLAGGMVAGAAGSLAMRTVESRYAPVVEVLRECSADRIAFNTNAHRVALSLDASEYHLVDGREVAGLGDIVIIGARFESNRPGPGGPRPPLPDYAPPAVNCRRLGNYTVWDLKNQCPDFGERCEP